MYHKNYNFLNHHKLFYFVEGGAWELGLNINPCDSGNFGYGGPWANEQDVGDASQSFTNDFLDAEIWKKKVGFLHLLLISSLIVELLKQNV